MTAAGQPFEVVVEDIAGVPTRVWKHALPTLRDVLEGSRAHAGRTFLVYEDERTTFAGHFAAVAALAHVLREEYGVVKGDRVAIAMRNYPEWIVAFWATVSIGAIAVTLNAWWVADELEYGLTDSGAKVLLADAERLARVHDRLGRLGVAAAVARPDGPLPDGVADLAPLLVPGPGRSDLPAVELAPGDDATIMYTSGTTGFPKGAVGTHRNMVTNLWSLLFRGALAAKQGDVPMFGGGAGSEPPAVLLTVPLFHVTGSHAIMLPALHNGSKVVMMYRWDPERALDLIEQERVTTFVGVPTMSWELLGASSFPTRDVSSLRAVTGGGAPMPPELGRRLARELPGARPGVGYGLTESSSLVTSNNGDDYLARPDSVGPPLPVVELRIVGADGTDAPSGGLGEVWVKGPNVVRGYWGKPEDTAATFSEGWLHTGDIGRLDDDGYLYVVDRVKDVVIRGGENVYCAEVEAAAYEHPAVAEAVVFGVPDERLGEEVGIAVVAATGRSLSAADLRAHLSGRMARFKVPARVWILGEHLPRNASGKIAKRHVRDLLLGEPPDGAEPEKDQMRDGTMSKGSTNGAGA